MAGYRRFIAYVYEYRKGKKGGNCGFIKVEVREERCSVEVHLHCEGITPQTECKIFGFVRKDGLINGILLGSCETQDDVVECLIETNSMNMAESGVALGKMGGMIFLTESGGFFGTEWDDQPIRPDIFKELSVSELPGKQEYIPQMEADKGDIASNINEERDIDWKNDVNKNIDSSYAEDESNYAQPDGEERGMEFTKFIEKEIGEEPAKSGIKEGHAEAGNQESKENIIDTGHDGFTGDKEENTGENKEESSSGSSYMMNNSERKLENDTKENDFLSSNSQTELSNDIKANCFFSSKPQIESSYGMKADDSISPETQIQTQSIEKNNNLSSPRLSGQKRNPAQFRRLPFGEEFMPFDDGEFLRSWKIRPDDLRYFPMRNRSMHNNRFLQQGYYNFGHILLAHKPGGQFILGVPGGYDQQERFMANMFGFPWFKASREIELPRNKGGYWYRLIDAPNLN